MKKILCLLLVLSLAACAAGPRTSPSDQAVPAAEESLSSSLPADDTGPDAAGDEAAEPAGGEAEGGTQVQLIQQPETSGRAVSPYKPMVALTFDDGPHATYTDEILDILEENEAVATFFEVAAYLYKDPEAVQRAAAMGCEVGSHSYRHANLGKMTLEEIQADLAAADEAFIQVLGEAPTLLRPPYGSVNTALKTQADRTLVTWSIDPEDWLCRDAETVVSRVQSAGNLDGQVILLHSIYGSTVEATRTLVPWLIEQGYQLVTVSELITLRYQQEIETNRLYNYDFFRRELPPLPEAPSGTPVADRTMAQGETVLKDGSPVTVKVVMTEGTQYDAAAGLVGGGYAFGSDNWAGRCALQVWREDCLLSSRDLEEAFGQELVFGTADFPLCFADYNGDGQMELSLGQWLSSNANCYVLYTLDEAGTARLVTQPAGVISSDGKTTGPYSAPFEKTEEGFAVSCYDNALGQTLREEYRWNDEQGLFLLAA